MKGHDDRNRSPQCGQAGNQGGRRFMGVDQINRRSLQRTSQGPGGTQKRTDPMRKRSVLVFRFADLFHRQRNEAGVGLRVGGRTGDAGKNNVMAMGSQPGREITDMGLDTATGWKIGAKLENAQRIQARLIVTTRACL